MKSWKPWIWRAYIWLLFLAITVWLTVFFLTIDLYRWQELVGGFFGAAIPLVIFYLSLRHQRVSEEKKKKEEKDEAYKKLLALIERHLTWAINNLASIDRMLHRFVKDKLPEYIKNVGDDDGNKRYSVGQIFLPLTPTFVLGKELLEESTGSLYLENSLMQVIAISQNLPTMMADLHRQFDRTISFSTQLGLMKVNTPSQHNAGLLENLEEFRKFLQQEIFDNNFPVYLRALAKARVAISKMQELGMEKWRETYNIATTYTPEQRYQMMEARFKDEINAEIESVKSAFDSKLVLVDEKTPYEIATST